MSQISLNVLLRLIPSPCSPCSPLLPHLLPSLVLLASTTPQKTAVAEVAKHADVAKSRGWCSTLILPPLIYKRLPGTKPQSSSYSTRFSFLLSLVKSSTSAKLLLMQYSALILGPWSYLFSLPCHLIQAHAFKDHLEADYSSLGLSHEFSCNLAFNRHLGAKLNY